MPKDRIGGHIDFVDTEGGRPGPTSTFIELEDATGGALLGQRICAEARAGVRVAHKDGPSSRRNARR